MLTTDASGGNTRYFYDAAHRQIRAEFPGHQSGVDRDAVDYAYLLTDQMESRTDQNGDTVLYGYDAAGRQTSLTYPDNSQDTFGYDLAGRLISASAGQYSTGFPLTRTYDPANRLIEETQSGRSVEYSYDRRHLKTSIQDSSGAVTTRTYTARGELDEVGASGMTYADYSYDAAGRQTSKALGNGSLTRMGYDVRNRTIRMTHELGTQDLQSLAYAYDAVGSKLLEENLTFPSRSQAFAYNNADRLVDWARGVPGGTASLTQAWVLDPLANWTTFTVNGVPEPRVHNASNELRSRGSTNLEYDANGNLTHDGTYVYAWDYNNRLQHVALAADNSPISDFAYDALGRRVQRVDAVAAETTEYVYDDEQVIEEYAPGPLRIASMAYGAYIDEPIVRCNSAGDLFYYHTNALFSPVALTDQAGAVVERYEYDAYGTVQTYDAAWSNPQAASRVGSPVTFTGRRLEPETGLLYFRARYYSPDQGRFIGRDPFGYVDGANLYRAYFVPNATDPTGNFLWCDDECDQEGEKQWTFEAIDFCHNNPNNGTCLRTHPNGIWIWIKGKCETCELQCCWWLLGLAERLNWDDAESRWYRVDAGRPNTTIGDSRGLAQDANDFSTQDRDFAKDFIEARCLDGTLALTNPPPGL